MRVVLVREAPGCEPNCFEWIMADGEITKETPAKFSAVFRTLGKRKPPVIINSVGGKVDAATTIGNLVRRHGLDVVVGRSRLVGCSVTEPCDDKPTGRAQRGLLQETTVSACASACVLVLAGGNRRILLPRAVVGVHQIRTIRPEQTVKRYRIYYRIVGGRRHEIRREEIGSKKLSRLQYDPGKDALIYTQLKAYVRRLGVEATLIDLFQRAQHESMHWLFDPDLKSTKLMTTRMALAELTGKPGANGKADAALSIPLPPEVPAPAALPPTRHHAGASVHAEHGGQPARIDFQFTYTREHPGAQADLYFAFAGAPVPRRLVKFEMRFDDGRTMTQNGIMGDHDFVPMKIDLQKSDLCQLASGRPVAFSLRIWPAGGGAAFDVAFGRASLQFRFMRTESPCPDARLKQAIERRLAEVRTIELGGAEIELGQEGTRSIALSMGFALNERERLINLSIVPTANGRNLPGGAASVLIETSEGKAWLALRQEGKAPFSPLLANLALADFCRIVAGEPIALSFERRAGAEEPDIALRRLGVTVALANPRARAACPAALLSLP